MKFNERFKNKSFNVESQTLTKSIFPLFLPVAFLPGALLLMLGVASLVAPKLVGALVALFFLFFGGVVLFLGWKVAKLKRNLEASLKGFQARVVVEQQRSQSGADTGEMFSFNSQDSKTHFEVADISNEKRKLVVIGERDKKIIFH